MRTLHANGTLQRARSFCARWLARHCRSPTVSAIVSRLARIGSKVAYWLDRGSRPTSNRMHLALPPPRQPGQIAHAGQDGHVRSDSLTLCDGLVVSAGLSVPSRSMVCAKRPCWPGPGSTSTLIHLYSPKCRTPSRATRYVIAILVNAKFYNWCGRSVTLSVVAPRDVEHVSKEFQAMHTDWP